LYPYPSEDFAFQCNIFPAARLEFEPRKTKYKLTLKTWYYCYTVSW
jgi:hypothetical protein